MIYLGIGLIVYVLSFYANYRWTQKAHSIHGIFSPCSPDGMDLFFTIFPLINTVVVLINLFDSPIKLGVNEKTWIDKFFNL